MPRKVRVLTTSFYRSGETVSIEENRKLACEFVDAAGPEKADLVCLPETFLTANVPRDHRGASEELLGPTFDALSKLARKHACWVVGTYNVQLGDGRIQNTALVIDRAGHLAGTYAKTHPTIREIHEENITPGDAPAVIETDFGRLGVAICYDIGWPDHWARLKEHGAELVIWPSAYDGGFPLQVYAWTHSVPIISAVLTEHSKVIDISGRVMASTSRWHRLTAATIDLEKEIFHTDAHSEKLFRLQKEFGQRATVQAFTEDHIFTLESNDPDWSVTRIKDYYGLENFRDYHARATLVQSEYRGAALPRDTDFLLQQTDSNQPR